MNIHTYIHTGHISVSAILHSQVKLVSSVAVLEVEKC